MEAGGGSALPCDTLDGVMLRCSKRGWPRKAAHAGEAELKAHEKASSYKELDDTRCDRRKSRAIPCARVDCCNAKSCDVPHASAAICERSPSLAARREKDGNDDHERGTDQPGCPRGDLGRNERQRSRRDALAQAARPGRRGGPLPPRPARAAPPGRSRPRRPGPRPRRPAGARPPSRPRGGGPGLRPGREQEEGAELPGPEVAGPAAASPSAHRLEPRARRGYPRHGPVPRLPDFPRRRPAPAVFSALLCTCISFPGLTKVSTFRG